MGVYKAAEWANQEERIPAGYKWGWAPEQASERTEITQESSSELRPCAQL